MVSSGVDDAMPGGLHLGDDNEHDGDFGVPNLLQPDPAQRREEPNWL